MLGLYSPPRFGTSASSATVFVRRSHGSQDASLAGCGWGVALPSGIGQFSEITHAAGFWGATPPRQTAPPQTHGLEHGQPNKIAQATAQTSLLGPAVQLAPHVNDDVPYLWRIHLDALEVLDRQRPAAPKLRAERAQGVEQRGAE